MWIVISLGIMAILTVIFGLKGFLAGLVNVLYCLWKGIEVLDVIASIFDILQVIIHLLSLLG